MLISLLARYVGNICSYLYPAYASYKALSTPANAPAADVQIERWLQYWAVVGTWTAVESVAGWLFTWIPFYSVVKAVILLTLSLPQTEGSTYIYTQHLAPLFAQHERDIDVFLAGLRGQAAEMLSGGAVWIWSKIREQMAFAPPQSQGGQQGLSGTVGGPSFAPAPPTLQDPASGPAQALYGYMSRYAAQYMPVALSALQAAASSAGNAASRATSSGSAAGSRDAGASSVSGYDTSGSNEPLTMPVPVPTPSPNTSGGPGDSLRSRTFAHAMAGGSASSSRENLGISSARQAHAARSVSTPSSRVQEHTYRTEGTTLSSRSSEESIQTRSSRSSLSQVQSGWHTGGGAAAAAAAEASYVDIRQEAAYDEARAAGPAAGYPTRPGGAERRRSSWFAWSGGPAGSTPDRPKAE